jgi:predicted Zn finger-like uncharacterized protein
MDVGCPNCQSEYELEDDRVPEDGVTVKCTSCSHVFRVKKKSLVVTLPARAQDATYISPRIAVGSGESSLPPSPTREWKVRHAGGNVFLCRDLTALQKWIIEGKVTRDDEISLSGETWKRLGDIPELASFFQIVEEAARGRALEVLTRVPPPPPAPSVPPGKGITETWKEKNFAAAVAAPSPSPAVPPLKESPFQKEATEPQFGRLDVARTKTPPQFRAPPKLQPQTPVDDDIDDIAIPKASGGWKRLVIGGIVVGAGIGWYFGMYLPEQKAHQEKGAQQASDSQAKERAQQDAARLIELQAAEQKAQAIAVAVIDAGAPKEESIDSGISTAIDAGAPVPPVIETKVDAGVSAVDAGAPMVAAKVDAGILAPVKLSFDAQLALGDRLRDREKSAQALDAYGRAHDMAPNRVEPLAGRGLALLDMGNPEAAQAAFEQALALSRNYGPAIMGMAEAFRGQKNNEKAIEWYQRYLDVLPNGGEAAVARNNIERLKR